MSEKALSIAQSMYDYAYASDWEKLKSIFAFL